MTQFSVTLVAILALCILCVVCGAADVSEEWLRGIGGTGVDDGYDIAVDTSGNVYVVGSFSGSVNFDGTQIASQGAKDIFITKYDSATLRNQLWVKAIGGLSDDVATSVHIDSASSAVYVCGYVTNLPLFDGQALQSFGGRDGFVAKYDLSGNIQWVKSLGFSDDDQCNGVTASSSFIYTISSFKGTRAFVSPASTITSNGGSDIFIAKFTSAGVLQNMKQFGGTGDDYGNSIAIDSSGLAYITGSFSGTVSFGTSSFNSYGQSDIVLAKLTSSLGVTWAKQAGSTGVDSGSSVTISGTTGSLVGVFSSTASFQGSQTISLTAVGLANGFVSKFSTTDGTFSWVRQIGNAQSLTLTSVAFETTSASICVAGAFSGSVTLDQTVKSSNGDTDAFFACYSTRGALQFVDTFGTAGTDIARGISVVSEYIYLVGSHSNNLVYRASSISSHGLSDALFTKVSFTNEAFVELNSYRMNIGGPEITDSKSKLWVSDSTVDTTRGTISTTPSTSIANTIDDAIYQTQRYAATVGTNMVLVFGSSVVPNGNYTLRIHLAETYTGAYAVGARQFKISINNVLVYPLIDIYQAVGSATAYILESTVVVTGGAGITIRGIHIVENPAIAGIEIIPFPQQVPTYIEPSNPQPTIFASMSLYPQETSLLDSFIESSSYVFSSTPNSYSSDESTESQASFIESTDNTGSSFIGSSIATNYNSLSGPMMSSHLTLETTSLQDSSLDYTNSLSETNLISSINMHASSLTSVPSALSSDEQFNSETLGNSPSASVAGISSEYILSELSDVSSILSTSISLDATSSQVLDNSASNMYVHSSQLTSSPNYYSSSSITELSSDIPSGHSTEELEATKFSSSNTASEEESAISLSISPEDSLPTDSSIVAISSQTDQRDPDYTITIWHNNTYKACEEGVIYASIFSGSEDITSSCNLRWTVVALSNDIYSSNETILNEVDTYSLRLDIDKFTRGRLFDIILQVSGDTITTKKEAVQIWIEDFQIVSELKKLSSSNYRYSQTVISDRSLSGDLCVQSFVDDHWFLEPYVSLPQDLTSKSSLRLPLSALPFVGRGYSIHHKLIINYSKLSSAYSQRTSREITAKNALDFTLIILNPRSIISGGSSITALIGDDLQFDGSASKDQESVDNALASFLWKCSPATICNINGLNNSNQVRLVLSGVGYANLTLVYSVGARSATSSVSIRILDNSVQIPKVTLSEVPGVLVGRKSKLSFSASLQSGRYEDVDFSWSLAKFSTIIPLNSTNLKTLAINSRSIALKEGSLESGMEYTMTLKAKFKSSNEYLAATSYVFRTSNPPFGGSISVSPINGLPLTTKFTLDTSGWEADPETLPLRYTYKYFDPSKSMSVPVATGEEALTRFPYVQGARSVLSTLVVLVEVQNALGDIAIDQYSIAIEPLSSAQMESAIRDLAGELANEENPSVLLNSMGALVSSMSSASNMTSAVISLLGKTMDMNMTSESVSMQMSMASTLSSSGTKLSKSDRSIMMALMNNILLSANAASLMTEETMGLVGNIVSSVAGSAFSSEGSEEESKQVMGIVSAISSVSFSYVEPGGDPFKITTPNLAISVQTNYGNSLQGAKLSFTDTRRSVGSSNYPLIVIPDLSVLTTDEQLFVQLVSYGDGINPYSWSQSSENITSSVVTFNLMQPNNTGFTQFALRDLEKPIEIRIKKLTSEVANNFLCQSWDEYDPSVESWNAEGCKYSGSTDDYILCECVHTTSFAAFIQYDANSKIDSLTKGVYIYSIIYYSLVGTIATALLLFVSINWRKQPIRSRSIVPFVGLTAILSEAILQGLVRNITLLTINLQTQFRIVNAIGYVVSSIVSPLGLIAMIVFLWQMVRYLFMKRLASLLVEGKSMRAIRIFRLLTSKLVIVGIVFIVGALSFTYFVVFSIIGGTGAMDPNSNSITQSISYTIMEVVIAALVILVFTWDISFYLRKRKKLNGMEDEETQSYANINKKMKKSGVSATDFHNSVYDHFVTNDPLLFRLESLFMVLSIMMLVVAFILGTIESFAYAKSVDQLNAPVTIGRVVFDTLYITLRLMVFGGVMTIRCIYFMKNSQTRKFVALLEETDSENTFTEIVTLLTNDVGYGLFETYCMKELSVENLLFWRELHDTSTSFLLLSEEERRKQLCKLNDKYIKRASPYEVNINGETRRAWTKYLEKDDVKNVEESTRVFKKLTLASMTNIADTYSRFSNTSDFALFNKGMTMKMELETNFTI